MGGYERGGDFGSFQGDGIAPGVAPDVLAAAEGLHRDPLLGSSLEALESAAVDDPGAEAQT